MRNIIGFSPYLRNMSKSAIHIQTTPTHFKYVYNLINSMKKIKHIESIEIFIVLDTMKELASFKAGLKLPDKMINLSLVTLEEIVEKLNLNYKESYTEIINSDKKLEIFWGAGGHRDFVAIKRTYSILYIKSLGYDYCWCLDSESFILDRFDINDFFKTNSTNNILLIGTGVSGVRYPELLNSLFNFDKKTLNRLRKINIRMNDFWFINTSVFNDLVDYLFEKYKKPISYFMNGSEQSLYEYFLYSLFINNEIEINLFKLNGDMHENNLFSEVIKNPKTFNNLSKFLNEQYFNNTYSYRGDYIKILETTQYGKMLLKKLNIKIAVSNYQGF